MDLFVYYTQLKTCTITCTHPPETSKIKIEAVGRLRTHFVKLISETLYYYLIIKLVGPLSRYYTKQL